GSTSSVSSCAWARPCTPGHCSEDRVPGSRRGWPAAGARSAVVAEPARPAQSVGGLTPGATRLRSSRHHPFQAGTACPGRAVGGGLRARSFTGFQAAIRTDRAHTRARITQISTERVRQSLDAGEIAVVAGFQGLSDEDEITTLGRGGSDLTAVALAAALKAEVCEI